MLFLPVIIDPVDVRYGVDGPPVLIVRVILAVAFIAVDVVEDFIEVFLGVFFLAEQLGIELQNLGPVHIGVPFIVHLNVFIQAGFQVFKLLLCLALGVGDFTELHQNVAVGRAADDIEGFFKKLP